MEYQYIHDEGAKTIYKFPKIPRISSKRDRNGNVITFSASMEIEITRADNVIVNSK
jgi:hypothetical protein